VLLQLLENQTPPLLFQTVMPIVSLVPGLPLSVIVTWRVALPSIEIVEVGFVMSWMLALPLNVAVDGQVLLGFVEVVQGLVVKDVIELPLIWYT
jgi:hypothetical protein